MATGVQINGKILSVNGVNGKVQVDGVDIKAGGATISGSLPVATTDNFGSMVFVIGDTTYLCASNVENPTSNSEVFWVEV